MELLERWGDDPYRKPLLLRGARQVGKSWLVRRYGRGFDRVVEVDFDSDPDLSGIFEGSLEVKRIVRDLSIAMGTRIVEGETLLFMDEIQECPRALKALRYFHDQMPRLHVVAAGSLVDFVIDGIGIPVGRLDFLHLYPLSFDEFLTATGNGVQRQMLWAKRDMEPLPEVAHRKLMDLLGQYIAVGGMPESVARWIETEDLEGCCNVIETLVESFRQDVTKYARRNQQPYVDLVLDAIPGLLGRKFVYSAVAQEVRSRTLRSALDLLVKAQIACRIHHTAANGMPLGAERNPGLFKVILMDVAIAQSILQQAPGPWILDPPATTVNRGPLTEAYVGQQLLSMTPSHARGELFYWMREKRAAHSEVDYIVAAGGHIVPIEVKSGKAGKLKSLRRFVQEKKDTTIAIQLCADNFSESGPVRSYPLYAVSTAMSQLRR